MSDDRQNRAKQVCASKDQTVVSLSCIDTGRGSILHWLFGVRSPETPNILRSCVHAYVLLIVFHFIIPTVIAYMTMPDSLLPARGMTEDRTEAIRVYYLTDYNVLFASLVTVPFLVVLLLTERSFIQTAIKGLADSKIIVFKGSEKNQDRENGFCQKWNGRYWCINVIAVCAGVIGAIVASCLNYSAQHSPGFGGWQFRSEATLISSWIFLIWQMPLIWFVLIVYAVRACAHLWFISEVVRESRIQVNFFHPDRSGGLQRIGRLGLRNQYSLSIVGINILLMIIVLTRTNPASDSVAEARLFDSQALAMVVITSAFYLVGAPIAFLGPLIPFHGSMLSAKQKYLSDIANMQKDEYERIRDTDNTLDSAEADIKRMERIERLQRLVEPFPVWPFDTGTLRKFSVSYFAPLLMAVGFKLAEEFAHWLVTICNSTG